MNNDRLNAVADMVPTNSFILDVGCDHAYLPIILIKSGKCKKAYASDISVNAISNAKENILHYNLTDKIDLFCTDGINHIPKDYDTLIICGMGTKTIKSILDGQNLPSIIILCSNNDHYELRKYMQKIGFKIDSEIVVFDKGKYYPIKYKEILQNMPGTKDTTISKRLQLVQKLLKKLG